MSEQGDSFSFVETEHKILDFWNKEQIFKKSLEQTKNGKAYIFYDGPPFATGLPHHGHLVGGTLKDCVPRYFTMKGHYVERRFGWDCHGLPIEHEIDKKLGMSAHDAVEKLGVAKYNQECRSIVQLYTKEWEKTINRMGRWVDFENDYKTMDLDFMESVWWVFKNIWDKDLIYQGNKVVPFSTKLGTVLSNFEANLNYQDVQDPAVTVLFKLKDEEAHLAAWTTTPWTLPSNLGLCVGAKIDYVLVKDEEKDLSFYLAEARLETYSKKRELTVLKTIKGSELKGKKYEPLFSYFSDLEEEGAFHIFNDNYVTTDNGTGIVHLAPAFGEDDNRVMKEAGHKAFVCPVNDQGEFSEEVSDYAGKYIKDADKEIIKKLKDEKKLYHQDVIVHSYPFCYRSDSPLIYKAIPTWYVNVEAIKEKLIKANEQINWVPSHLKHGRFGKWLENARDWAISRNRVWGTPLPIWINDETGNKKCFGSVEELNKATGASITDLHREFMDELTFTIDGEPGIYKRVPEVLDCWFESGSMPYAQLHYPFENKEVFDSGFPAAFIAEGLDQTRGWFYTLTVLSAALFDKPAFKNVIVNGMVLAEDGKKMSKRLKNYTKPDILMEKFGADALRLYMINSPLVRAEELRFTDAGVKDMVRRVLLPWYNAFKFFQTYATVDKWNPQTDFSSGENITDQWIISKQQTLIANVSKEMESYKLYNVIPALFNFIEDLTNWYIRLNRRRFWEEGLSEDKKQAYSTLYSTVKEISTLMAPFAPFLAEHIFLELKKLGSLEKESVHLCSYPEASKELQKPLLEEAVERLQQIILLGRQKRNQVKIKVKTPLSELVIIHQDKTLLNEIAKLEDYIKTEMNVKKVSYSQDEDLYIKLYAKPNSPVLGKKLGKEFGKFRGLIQKLDTTSLRKLEAGESIEIEGQSFDNTEILIFREALEGKDALSNSYISISMDCNLTEDLILEGLAREVVNRVQKTRKDLNFNVSDRIHITYSGSDKILKAIEKHQDYITKETLCQKIENSEGELEFKIDDEVLKVTISKI